MSDQSNRVLVEQLNILKRTYMAQLPFKIERMAAARKELQNSVDTEILDELCRLLHNLAGSGGTYGFLELSAAARECEQYLRTLYKKNGDFDADTLAQLDAGMASVSKIAADITGEEATAGGNDMLGASADEVLPPNVLPSNAPWSAGAKRMVYLLGENFEEMSGLANQVGHFGYAVRTFETVQDLQEALAVGAPAAVIADVAIEADWDKLRQALRLPAGSHDSQPAAPIIYVAESGEIETRLAAVRANGHAYFTKPFDISEVVDTLDRFAGPESPTPFRILIIEDESSLASYFSVILEAAGMTTQCVTDPMETLPVLTEFRPDLILMDVYMPSCTGLELATVIRQQEDFVSIPIVFLSAETDIDKQLTAMSSGADDFLTKPIQPEHLVASVAARAERSRTLRSFMIRDSLTGLLNHTTTKEQLAGEMARARRSGSRLSFAMIDVDCFKNINDSHGHLTGDRVIKSLSRILTQRLRTTDVVGRYGGEEFAVILVDTDADTAMLVLDEIRTGFSKILHNSPSGEFSVTFSAGVAQFPGYDEPNLLNDAADRALYEAKRTGRNRVVLAR